MDKLLTEFDYELKTPFEYDFKGSKEQAKFITLYSPTMKHMEHREPIVQAFYQAVSEQTPSGEESSNDVDIKGSDVIALLRISEKVDTYKVGLHFKELLASKDIALIDGQERLIKPLIDKLNPEDFDNIMGEYLCNFMLASLLDKTKKQSD